MGWIALAAGFYLLGLIPSWAGDTLKDRPELRSAPAVVMAGIGVFVTVGGIAVVLFLIAAAFWQGIQWFTT